MKIGFGIFCFGDEYYFKGAVEKINKILNDGYHCYVLTDNVEFFDKKYTSSYTHIIPYYREYKSYHDKFILPKRILEDNDVCILIDADIHIKDYSFLNIFKKYNFKKGISYIDTLINHPLKREYVKEMDLSIPEWFEYKEYCELTYPNYKDLILFWEHFIIINKDGFNQSKFYENYDKLQITKEFCDLKTKKDVKGNGEGISISIASKLSNTNIEQDFVLSDLFKDNIVSISRKFTNPEHLPKWMK